MCVSFFLIKMTFLCTSNSIWYPESRKGLRDMRAVKGWPVEIISTYTHEHNLGGQPCKYFAGNVQKAKIQNGRHKCLVYITFERLVQM